MRVLSIVGPGAAPSQLCQQRAVLRADESGGKRSGAMNVRLSMLSMLIVGQFLFLSGAHAQTPPIAQAEIDYLLEFVGNSGCEFYRNGKSYTSAKAQAHLRSKYKKVIARWQIDTAEDFIAKVATKSSVSGRAYAAKCGGAAVISASQWLTDALMRHRADGGPAPHT
jgi:hypothetical protein